MKQRVDTEQILERVDLADLAERAGATLKKSGDGYRGACPLHGGDNRSAFHIYTGEDGRQRWYCHTGCRTGGDAIDFMRLWRRLPDDADGFVQAVRLLAEFAGLPAGDVGLNTEQVRVASEQRKAERSRQETLTLAARYYARLLRSPAGETGGPGPGVMYARKRGWTDETIKQLGLGYSDGHLAEYLQEEDVSAEMAIKAGLLSRRDDGTLVDTIPAGYLVYPHHRNKVVTYLSARATFTDDKDRKACNLKAPKQLYWAVHNQNTPLTVVEGQACANTVWQWGHNAAALCGTHLTEEDARTMQAFPAVYLALDPDAEERIPAVADVLGPLTMIVSGILARDINDWHVQKEGTPEKLDELRAKAKPWIEIAIDQARRAPVYELEEHLEHLAELVNRLSAATRSRYIREICDRHRLVAAGDFRELMELAAHDNGDVPNGFDVAGGRFTYYGEPLCNFTARITHELAQDDGSSPPEILFTVQGTLDTDETLEPIDIKAEEFDALRWIARHWGARPTLYLSPGKTYQLRRAIQEASREGLIRERVHTFTGWATIDGQWTYLTASGGLGADSLNPNLRVDLGANNLGRYALPAPPADLRPAIRASLDFLSLAPFGVTLPLWTAMYAAPLSPLRTLNATLWVYGTTQSGKSTICHLALAHFGPTFIEGHEYRAPKDWTSTLTDLERAAFVIKDAPLVIDDYAPAHAGATEARQAVKTANYIIRSVGNRSSRGRAKADLSEQRQRPPRGLVIATAENPIVGHSTVGRMIYIPVETGDVIRSKDNNGDETDLDRAQQQATAGLYAQAMAGYVAWLAGKWHRLAEEVPARIDRASRAGRAFFPSNQSRLTDYYALLVTASDLALEYAASYGVLSQDDVELQAEIHRHHLVELLCSQAERVNTQSPVLKFFNALAEMLAQRKVYFAPRRDTSFTPPTERAELVGWYDREQGHVYLLTNAALTLVKGYWQALDERFETLADALRREMWQQDLIVARDGKNFEQKPYINKKVGTVRVLVLDGQVLADKYGLDLLDNGDEPEE